MLLTERRKQLPVAIGRGSGQREEEPAFGLESLDQGCRRGAGLARDVGESHARRTHTANGVSRRGDDRCVGGEPRSRRHQAIINDDSCSA